MRAVLTNAGAQLILSNFLASANFPLYLGLYKNNLAPNKFTLQAVFVECDYTGYAHQSVTTGTLASNDQVDGSGSKIGVYSFAAVLPATPNVIYGCFLAVARPGTLLIAAAKFPTPYNVDSQLAGTLKINLSFGLTNRG